jgi:hypothetical protein
MAEGHVVPMKPGNAGGGKEPWSKTNATRSEDAEIGQPINSGKCSAASSRVDGTPSGKVLLNIYRPDEFFSAQRTFLVFDRSKFIGSLGVGTSMQYIADPGEHLIIACACAGAQSAPVQVPSAVRITLVAGQTYDLMAEFATGWDMGQAALGDRVKSSEATVDAVRSLRQSSKLVLAREGGP